MQAAYDLVIRGGLVVDGFGGEPCEADVAVLGGRITDVGDVQGAGREEIAAVGRLVTPGFIDIHTHYDGQATWAERMQPSSAHGVTTVVTGNCGVGFAPCRPADRDMLVELMEGVEDIPEIVLKDGLPWTWESFEDYVDFLKGRRFDVDVATQVAHSAIRVFVMGRRGAAREPATAWEIEQMRDLVACAVRAGAVGVSSSRHINHRTRAGEMAPSVDTADAELLGLARGLRDAGAGVFQIIPRMPADPEAEFALMRRLAEASGRPLSFSLVGPGWRDYLGQLDAAADPTLRAQVYPRPAGVLLGLDLSCHPFSLNPSYRPIAELPLAEKVAAMRDPPLRARLLDEEPQDTNEGLVALVRRPNEIFRLCDPPDYVPPLEEGATAEARRRGVSRKALIYDWLLEDEGRQVLYQPGSNFAEGGIEAIAAMLHHPAAILGLGDGGAHYGMLCDASFPTTVLTDWARDGRFGGISLPWAVNALTRRPAEALGLADRGAIAAGLKADLNIIDLDRLGLAAPTVVRDLPAGGRRLLQLARGYVATIVAGEVTHRDGAATGALPGRLVRGQAAAPA